jgi:hypothetical protein
MRFVDEKWPMLTQMSMGVEDDNVAQRLATSQLFLPRAMRPRSLSQDRLGSPLPDRRTFMVEPTDNSHILTIAICVFSCIL